MMSAAWPAPATPPDNRIVVVSAAIRERLRDMIAKEIRRLDRAAELCRQHGVRPKQALAAEAAELRHLARELAR